MNSRERVATAMQLGVPDRVPVMCQLAIGHYFLYSGLAPLEVWFTSEGFAEALVKLARRYHFDGILVNLPGRDPDWETHVDRIDTAPRETRVHWKNGCFTTVPHDDNPHYYQPDGSRYFPTFEEVDPGALFYVEPWDLSDITYPYTWGMEAEPRPRDAFFPPWNVDTVRAVRAKAGPELSVHGELFSPFAQLLELLNYENALLAILDDPGKVHACLAVLAEGAIDLGRRLAAEEIDAIDMASPFAGAGLISRQHYQEFVLPYERRVIDGIHAVRPDLPLYTHTCGSIGDRLDLMLETRTNGIDTLDPPPLGTVELPEAKRILAGKAFIKGNVDPVNTLLNGTRERILADVAERLAIGAEVGGYILSTACAVAPHTRSEHIELLAAVASSSS